MIINFSLRLTFATTPISAGQVGIFPRRLLPSAPARIAENIDVGRQEPQPGIAFMVIMPKSIVRLRAALGRDHISYLRHQRSVPGGSQPDCLREGCRRAIERHAMQCFVIQPYASTSNRGIAAAPDIVCETFSSNVILRTKSAARCSAGMLRSRYAGFRPFCAAAAQAVAMQINDAKYNRNPKLFIIFP